MALLVSWLGASIREQAAFLGHRPLAPRAVIAGRLAFLLGFIAVLVLIALVIQGVFAETPTEWMSRSTFWALLAQNSALALLKFSLTATLAMGLARLMPSAGASLLAILPLLVNRWSEQGQALVLGVQLHYAPEQLSALQQVKPYALAMNVAPQGLVSDPTTWLRAGVAALLLLMLLLFTVWAWTNENGVTLRKQAVSRKKRHFCPSRLRP